MGCATSPHILYFHQRFDPGVHGLPVVLRIPLDQFVSVIRQAQCDYLCHRWMIAKIASIAWLQMGASGACRRTPRAVEPSMGERQVDWIRRDLHEVWLAVVLTPAGSANGQSRVTMQLGLWVGFHGR
jgi:hypothetical protein